ncbi:hypothetical protein AB4Z27_09920 [Cupriavidus sp. KB_39]|uniref:hypothetical protein n=1 Tax=Cupriavidus sp. KB_39 TaxID=3233036 RepID=UPI003F92AD29
MTDIAAECLTMPVENSCGKTLMDEPESKKDRGVSPEAQQVRAAMSRMDSGMERAYLYLLNEVREYALELLDSVVTDASGHPADERSQALTDVAARLERLLSQSILEVKGNVERS